MMVLSIAGQAMPVAKSVAEVKKEVVKPSKTTKESKKKSEDNTKHTIKSLDLKVVSNAAKPQLTKYLFVLMNIETEEASGYSIPSNNETFKSTFLKKVFNSSINTLAP